MLLNRGQEVVAMMNLTSLYAFQQVARTGSFTAAGEALGISASAVSKAIMRLEKELGIKLLHRTTRSLSLTGDGKKLAERTDNVLEQLRRVREELLEGREQLTGVLRLNFPSALGRNVLIEAVTEFVTRHPKLRAEVSFDDRLIDLAEEGIDVVVRTGRLSDSTSLVVTRFFAYQAVLCASPEFLSQCGPIRSRGDLEKLACVHFQVRASGKVFPWKLRGGPFTTRSRFVFEDLTAICRAAVAGAGVALLPTWSCLDELNSGALVEILPSLRPEPTTVWLGYHDRRYNVPRIRKFLEAMKELGQRIGDRYLRPA